MKNLSMLNFKTVIIKKQRGSMLKWIRQEPHNNAGLLYHKSRVDFDM